MREPPPLTQPDHALRSQNEWSGVAVILVAWIIGSTIIGLAALARSDAPTLPAERACPPAQIRAEDKRLFCIVPLTPAATPAGLR